MRNIAPTLISSTLALALFASPAAAESKSMDGDDHKSANANAGYKSTDVVGREVVSQDGQSLGTIQDLVFDSSGRLIYFVLSGVGSHGKNLDKMLVPWARLDHTSEPYRVDFHAEKMTNAPTLSSRDIDNLADPQTRREADSYFEPNTFKDIGMAGKLNEEKIRHLFAKYDRDSDGALGRGEFGDATGLISMFREFDSDGNGSISRSEFGHFVRMNR